MFKSLLALDKLAIESVLKICADYNNTKNASISNIPFEFKCGFYPQVLFEEDDDLFSKSDSANKTS